MLLEKVSSGYRGRGIVAVNASWWWVVTCLHVVRPIPRHKKHGSCHAVITYIHVRNFLHRSVCVHVQVDVYMTALRLCKIGSVRMTTDT